MAFPVTLNGRTYTLTDFEGTNYVDGLPDAFEDFVTQAGQIYSTTSTTSNSIGTGSKTFTVEASKPYQVGTPLRIADTAAVSTNWIDGIVTAYSGTTLTVNAVAYAGSGTKTAWSINIGGGPIAYTGTLPIAQGGTGATTAAAARTNIDVYSKSESESRYLNISGDTGDVSFTGDLTITGSDAGTRLMVKSTNAGAADGPIVDLDRDSSSPVTGDDIGQIFFSGQNDADEKIQYGIIEGFIQDPTDGAEHGMVNYTYMVNGSKVGGLQMRGDQGGTAGEINVNNGGLDMNFRIEGESDANLFFVDASTDRIGIGTNSPSHLLDVEGSADMVMRIGATGTGDADCALRIDGADTGESAVYFDTDGVGGAFISMTGGAGGDLNIATVESSGRNIDLQPQNIVTMRVLVPSSATNTTEILEFFADSTSAGKISAIDGDLTIGEDAVGIKFENTGTDRIIPVNVDTLAVRDDAINLGGDGERFKSLFLSGGVYLGGTGSDNLLDDYEHGFFTPTYGGLTTNPSSVSYDPTVGNEGYYVKVGRAVFVQINIRTDGISNVGAGGLVIQGLPFVAPSLSGQGGTGSLAVSQAKDFAGEVPDAAYVSDGLDYVTLFYRSTSDGGSAASQCSDLATGSNDNLIRLGGTYYVTV